jgi:hypothetical protein
MCWRTASVQCILSNGSRSVIDILLSYAQCWCSIIFFAFNVLKNSFCPVHLEQGQQICDWHPPLLCTMLVLNLFFSFNVLKNSFCPVCLEQWQQICDWHLMGRKKDPARKGLALRVIQKLKTQIIQSTAIYEWIHALDVQCNLPPISISFVHVCIISGDNQTTIGWWWAVYMRKGWCLDMSGDMTSGMT